MLSSSFPIPQFHATGGASSSEALFCISVDFSVGPFEAAAAAAEDEKEKEGEAVEKRVVDEAAKIVRKQVLEHLELGEKSFWKAEMLHKALVEEQK